MRYALYLTPPQGSALAQAAAAWLGRSPFSGASSQPVAPRVAAPHVPARYGFHATMCAPFRLVSDASEEDLRQTFHRFCAGEPVLRPKLAVSRLSRFLALTADEADELSAAHRRALRAFEPLRAPLSEADRARREPDRLDDRGRELLDAWGYPHVMERFRFHMTLSGPMEPAHHEAVAQAARSHFGALLKLPQPLVFALFREAESSGPFWVIAEQRVEVASR